MLHAIGDYLLNVVGALLGSALIGLAVVYLDGYATVTRKPIIPEDIEQAEEYDK